MQAIDAIQQDHSGVFPFSARLELLDGNLPPTRGETSFRHGNLGGQWAGRQGEQSETAEDTVGEPPITGQTANRVVQAHGNPFLSLRGRYGAVPTRLSR